MSVSVRRGPRDRRRAVAVVLSTALVTLAWAALLVPAARAAETAVTYVAGASVYLDAGRAEGLAEGDTVEVVRNGAVIARLRVAFLSTHRAAGDTLSTSALPRTGDVARFTARAAPSPVPAAAATGAAIGSAAAGDTVPGGAAPGAAATGQPATATAAMPAAANPAGTFHGRIAGRFFNSDNRDASDYRVPALDLWLNGTNLGRLPLDLAVDARARRITQSFAGGASNSVDRSRVYRLSLTVHDWRKAWQLTVGRQISPLLATVSLFDGALAQVGGPRWALGAFGGTQPDPVTMDYSSRIAQGGGFVQVRSRPGMAGRSWWLALGGAVSTDQGQPNRNFAFAQGSWQGRRLSASFAQEVDVNPAWKRDQGESSVTLTSTFATARYQAARPFALYAGYDNRRSVRLWRDHETPETQFDDQYRQGIWGGVQATLGRSASVGGEVRTSDNASGDDAIAWSATAELYRHLPWRGALRARVAQWDGDLRNQLVVLSLAVTPVPAFQAQVAAGRRSTEDTVAEVTTSADWQSVDFDVTLGRQWLLSGSIEHTQGDLEDLVQEFVGLSWRF